MAKAAVANRLRAAKAQWDLWVIAIILAWSPGVVSGLRSPPQGGWVSLAYSGCTSLCHLWIHATDAFQPAMLSTSSQNALTEFSDEPS